MAQHSTNPEPLVLWISCSSICGISLPFPPKVTKLFWSHRNTWWQASEIPDLESPSFVSREGMHVVFFCYHWNPSFNSISFLYFTLIYFTPPPTFLLLLSVYSGKLFFFPSFALCLYLCFFTSFIYLNYG